VTRSPPSRNRSGCLGDSAYDTLGWHDHLLAAGVVPVAPYNARNTDDPKDIEYRVEARIDEHSGTFS